MDQARENDAALGRHHQRTTVRLSLGLAGILITLMSFPPSLNVFADSLPAEAHFPLFAYISITAAILSCLLATRATRYSETVRKGLVLLRAAAFLVGNTGYVLLFAFPCLLAAFLWLWVATGIIVGIGSPAACLLWRQEFQFVDVTASLRASAAAGMIYGLYLLFCAHSCTAFAATIFLLATVAIVAFPMARRGGASETCAPVKADPLKDAPRSSLPAMLPAVAGIAVFAFVMGFRRGGMDVNESDALSTGFLVAGAITLALSHVTFSKPPINHYYQVLLPTCATILVPLSYICSLAEAKAAASFIIYVLFGIVGAFSLAAVTIFGQSDELDGVKFVAGTFGLYNFMSLFGLMLVENTPGIDRLQAIVFVGLSVAYFGFLSVSPNLPVSAKPTEAEPNKAAARTQDELLARVCASLAVTAGLSPRESQIFALLAKGFSASYVSGALLISESTARTHVSNIYRKLNVTCRDELLVLVAERNPQAMPVVGGWFHPAGFG